MQTNSYKTTVPAAMAIGIAQSVLLVWCWACIAAYSPIPRLFIDFGLIGDSWRVVIGFIDLLINIALTLPAAYLLSRFRPRNIPLYIAVAVVPMFIWNSRLIFFGEIGPGVSWTLFVPSWAMELLSFPLAVALVVTLRRLREV